MSSKTTQTLAIKYVLALQKNPLLTKCITGGVLAVLNELIATTVSGQLNITQINNHKLKHPFSWKLVLFALYAFFVATPISHYGYQWLNKLFKAPLSSKQKLLQILGSMATITPVSSTLFVGFVAVMNMKPGIQALSKDEWNRAFGNIKAAWKKSLLTVLKSSWITGPFAVAICQKFIAPELWTVFTSICYFVLGTAQNTLLKIRTKKAQEYQKKRDDIVGEVEKKSDDDDAAAPSDVLKQSTSTGVDV